MDVYDIVRGIVETVIIVAFLIFMCVYVIPFKEEEDKKDRCYEIYATDNVILKECEKYFGRSDE